MRGFRALLLSGLVLAGGAAFTPVPAFADGIERPKPAPVRPRRAARRPTPRPVAPAPRPTPEPQRETFYVPAPAADMQVSEHMFFGPIAGGVGYGYGPGGAPGGGTIVLGAGGQRFSGVTNYLSASGFAGASSSASASAIAISSSVASISGGFGGGGKSCACH